MYHVCGGKNVLATPTAYAVTGLGLNLLQGPKILIGAHIDIVIILSLLGRDTFFRLYFSCLVPNSGSNLLLLVLFTILTFI